MPLNVSPVFEAQHNCSKKVLTAAGNAQTRREKKDMMQAPLELHSELSGEEQAPQINARTPRRLQIFHY